MPCSPTDIDPEARALICHKVRRLVGQYGFTPADREDLAQELALQAHVASRHYDPTRAKAVTFFEQVLTRKVVSLIRHQRAHKRRRGRVHHGGGDAHLSIAPACTADLSLDLRELLRHLPHGLQTLALSLTDQSLAEASRSLGLTRQQARTRSAALADHLRQAGFAPERKYSSCSSTNPTRQGVYTSQRRAPKTGHTVEAVTAPERSCAHAA